MWTSPDSLCVRRSVSLFSAALSNAFAGRQRAKCTQQQMKVCICSKLCVAAQIAALAVALKYAASPEFNTYAKQVSSDKQASQAMLFSASVCSLHAMSRQLDTELFNFD